MCITLSLNHFLEKFTSKAFPTLNRTSPLPSIFTTCLSYNINLASVSKPSNLFVRHIKIFFNSSNQFSKKNRLKSNLFQILKLLFLPLLPFSIQSLTHHYSLDFHSHATNDLQIQYAPNYKTQLQPINSNLC